MWHVLKLPFLSFCHKTQMIRIIVLDLFENYEIRIARWNCIPFSLPIFFQSWPIDILKQNVTIIWRYNISSHITASPIMAATPINKGMFEDTIVFKIVFKGAISLNITLTERQVLLSIFKR